MKKLLLLATLFAGLVINAAIVFDKGANEINITDFSLESPCTLEKLAQFDKLYKWNKVKFFNGTYTIDCNVVVGNQTAGDSVLLIDKPLVMNGLLMAAPFYIKGISKNPKWWLDIKKNYIIIKDTTVKFGPEAAIHSGIYFKNGKIMRDCAGGGILVNNSKLLASKGKFAPKGLWWWGLNHEIIDSTIDGVGERVCYGMGTKYGKTTTIKNSTFSNYNWLAPQDVVFENCTFTKGYNAIIDFGIPAGKFINCTFKNNVRNFSLGGGVKPNQQIELINCNIKKSKAADNFKKSPQAAIKYPAKLVFKNTYILSGTPGEVVLLKPSSPNADWVANTEIKISDNGSAEVILNDKTITASDNGAVEEKFQYTPSAGKLVLK